MHSNDTNRAFTRVELLVILAILSILTGMLFPALVKSKAKAQGIMCMSNTKQLMLAMQVYMTDSSDQFPIISDDGAIESVTRTNESAAPFFRIRGRMSWDTNPDNTNILNLAPAGHFYKCPADILMHQSQLAPGWTARVRSISVNGVIGSGGKPPTDELLQCEKRFLKMSDVTRPAPSQLWMFVDEHPDSIDDGAFYNAQLTRRWISMPANYHNGAGGLAFVDGHSEIKKWRSTVLLEKPNFTYSPPAVWAGDPDWGWLLDRTSFHTNAVR